MVPENRPQPGSCWQQRKTDLDEHGWRRLLFVETVDDGDGFVHGIGQWQQHVSGRWQNAPYNRRKTRIRTRRFVRDYVPLAEENDGDD